MMIKENTQIISAPSRPMFHPTFGSRPVQIIGRNDILDSCLSGLKTPVGSRQRCTFIKGQRGMGKTSLILEIAERAEKEGFVVARVTAYEGMCDEIIEELQRNGSAYIDDSKPKLAGVNAGAFGFSVGLTFSESTEKQYGFRGKLTLLCDRLTEAGKGVLILVDEACTSKAMRELAIAYQELVGEDKNIAIYMAGLPQAVSTILDDDVLTFLNRAEKVELGPIDIMDMQLYMMNALNKMGIKYDMDLLNEAVDATKGFPYLFQLIGYYMLELTSDSKVLTKDILDDVIKLAIKDMEQNVFRPMLKPLSERDVEFLQAMSRLGEVCKISDLSKSLNWTNAMIQPYRARIIDSGIAESPSKGRLEFVVPFLRDYLNS